MVLERQGKQSEASRSDRGACPCEGTVRLDALTDLVRRGLSERERLVVMLTYAEGLTADEVGQVLDLSEPEVQRMLSAIRSRLRAQWGWKERSTADPED